MRSVAGVALIAPARGRASKKIINIMHTGAARCFWKPKWPWVKTKPPKPSTTGRAVCNARFLLREVHVSGALSGACTGKGPQIANPRPTPKPGNLGPPWPPGTSGDPAGYSRGRPLGAQDYRWFVRDPLGLTPPGYELAPHTGLDKAPPRTRDEGRLDARATSHWSRIATQPRSCLPGAVTSA
jgi:hypothetical protein